MDLLVISLHKQTSKMTQESDIATKGSIHTESRKTLCKTIKKILEKDSKIESIGKTENEKMST